MDENELVQNRIVDTKQMQRRQCDTTDCVSFGFILYEKIV